MACQRRPSTSTATRSGRKTKSTRPLRSAVPRGHWLMGVRLDTAAQTSRKSSSSIRLGRWRGAVMLQPAAEHRRAASRAGDLLAERPDVEQQLAVSVVPGPREVRVPSPAGQVGERASDARARQSVDPDHLSGTPSARVVEAHRAPSAGPLRVTGHGDVDGPTSLEEVQLRSGGSMAEGRVAPVAQQRGTQLTASGQVVAADGVDAWVARMQELPRDPSRDRRLAQSDRDELPVAQDAVASRGGLRYRPIRGQRS